MQVIPLVQLQYLATKYGYGYHYTICSKTINGLLTHIARVVPTLYQLSAGNKRSVS